MPDRAVVSAAVRVLVIGPYPPMRDGIAVYVRDEVERMRTEGDHVTVLSPPEGKGDVRRPLRGGSALLWAFRHRGGFDRIVVEFQPSLYFAPRRAISKVVTSNALALLASTRPAEIVVHEADPPKLWRPDYLVLRAAFRLARRLVFHTQAEWRSLERRYHVRVRGSVVQHTVSPASPGIPSRERARRALALRDISTPMFLCAGFLQPSKGYDRAVNAFATTRARAASGASKGAAQPPPGSLYVVGSVREHTAENVAYAEELRTLCDATPGVMLVERYVDDAEFDRWMVAADRVVLPYRRAWSSGVLARAHALGTPALVADVGGLAEQAGPGDVVFTNDEELERAMQDVVDG